MKRFGMAARCALLSLVLFVPANAQEPEPWIRSVMNQPRNLAAGMFVALPGGRAMVLGGFRRADLRTPEGGGEIYDSSTNQWTVATPLPPAAAQVFAAMASLGSGKVLYAGGAPKGLNSSPGDFSRESFLYDPESDPKLHPGIDPSSDPWAPTAPLPSGRAATGRTVARLQDGRVLVAGGFSALIPAFPLHISGAWIASAETFIFDPGGVDLATGRTGTWSTAGTLNIARTEFNPVTTGDGKVIAFGARIAAPGLAPESISTAEVFDPKTNEWTPTPPMPPIQGEDYDVIPPVMNPDGTVRTPGDRESLRPGSRWEPGTALLRDGRVLVSGGVSKRLVAPNDQGTTSGSTARLDPTVIAGALRAVASPGDTTLFLGSVDGFPTLFPYQLIVGSNDGAEVLTVFGVGASTNTLAVSVVTKPHPVGDPVTLELPGFVTISGLVGIPDLKGDFLSSSFIEIRDADPVSSRNYQVLRVRNPTMVEADAGYTHLRESASKGDGSLRVLTIQHFPESAFPYTVRVGPDPNALLNASDLAEDAVVVAVDYARSTFTLQEPLAKDHGKLELVTFEVPSVAQNVSGAPGLSWVRKFEALSARRSCLLFDPQNPGHPWNQEAGPAQIQMTQARVSALTAGLASGRAVALMGVTNALGRDDASRTDGRPLGTAELFDPGTLTWQRSTDMPAIAIDHVDPDGVPVANLGTFEQPSVLLDDGTILIAGFNYLIGPRSTLREDAPAGSTSIRPNSVGGFPATGQPYGITIGSGASAETRTFTAPFDPQTNTFIDATNTPTTDTFFLGAPLAGDHVAGERINFAGPADALKEAYLFRPAQ